MRDTKKIALVGTGFVGTSFAYALLNQQACDELVLIDVDKARAKGEAMDLNHGLAFSSGNMDIYDGDYKDCADADIVCICAGVNQQPGESRIALLQRNSAIFQSIVAAVLESGFTGIFLVATNPVDIMTQVTQRISGFPANRVIGTGTTLDTARLRYLLGKYFSIDPRNVHAYVIGEHGDSEFVPWSQALLATKPVLRVCEEFPNRFRMQDLEDISQEVKRAAEKIIRAKKATYYGIGMALTRIVKAIFGNENSVLTVSSLLCGAYGQEHVYIGSPCILNRSGVQSLVRLSLTDDELAVFHRSCDFLRSTFADLMETAPIGI